MLPMPDQTSSDPRVELFRSWLGERGESVPDKTRWIGNPIGPWQQLDEAETDG